MSVAEDLIRSEVGHYCKRRLYSFRSGLFGAQSGSQGLIRCRGRSRNSPVRATTGQKTEDLDSQPPSEILRLNVDGSFHNSNGTAGIGGIIRDNCGRLFLAFAFATTTNSAIEAEICISSIPVTLGKSLRITRSSPLRLLLHFSFYYPSSPNPQSLQAPTWHLQRSHLLGHRSNPKRIRMAIFCLQSPHPWNPPSFKALQPHCL
ncbi:hypothetical protein MRB53_013542 [Persea americana]|uniref:Uncharacterized protein n=1 Tax=Persea americana TaxID=3435 RepID=A0ACC2K8C8_PERAE|nr:hypothetical protein MRB53_013542 [Persea americana]